MQVISFTSCGLRCTSNLLNMDVCNRLQSQSSSDFALLFTLQNLEQEVDGSFDMIKILGLMLGSFEYHKIEVILF